MASKVHLYRVEMTCESCANAVSNCLNKNKENGIENFEINLKEKMVTIHSALDSNAITEILQKTGKPLSYMGEKK